MIYDILMGNGMVKVDKKSRIQLPAKIARALQPEEIVYVLVEKEHLEFYPKSRFKPKDLPESCLELKIEKRYRIAFKKFSDLTSEDGRVLVVGCLNIFEVWNKEKYFDEMNKYFTAIKNGTIRLDF